jgi:hypothetical protein
MFRGSKRAGSDTCRECAFLAVTRVDNRTHSRRNRTRSTVRVNLNEAVTCLTDLEEEHSRSLARSHVACRCTASARSAKPCPAMTNRGEYFMQHHASSTHWEEVPCALTDYVKMLAPSHVVSFICGHALVPRTCIPDLLWRRRAPFLERVGGGWRLGDRLGDYARPFLSGSVEAGVFGPTGSGERACHG